MDEPIKDGKRRTCIYLLKEVLNYPTCIRLFYNPDGSHIYASILISLSGEELIIKGLARILRSIDNYTDESKQGDFNLFSGQRDGGNLEDKTYPTRELAINALMDLTED